MYKKLIETENEEMNQIQVNSIKQILSELKRIVDYELKDNIFKIEENNKIIDIVKRILYFNQPNQKGQGLRISKPD